jgi:manganese/zinc/iron transport system substrate-binding protein
MPDSPVPFPRPARADGLRRALVGRLVLVALGVALLAAALAVAGCAPQADGGASGAGLGDRPLRVVATTNVVGDLVREVGGNRVVLTTLMGPGVDPHLYKASAGDVGRMSGADLVVYNGLHLEGKMTEVFAQMRQRGVPTVAVAEQLAEDRLIGSPDYASSHDPHVWFDVALWADAARALGDALARRDTAHAAAYRRRATAYAARLDTLDAYVRRQAARVPERQRVLVTSHDAFGYLGRAYAIEVRGLQGLSTATEAGTADVQALAGFVAERQIPALFVESSVSPRGIQAVRQAVAARGHAVRVGGTLYGDALGDRGTPAGTYEGAVRHNIDTIVSGLLSEGGV